MNCTVLLRTSSSVFIASYHTSTVALFPAYGSYARSTSGSKKNSCPSDRKIACFFAATKSKNNAKVALTSSKS